MDPGPKNGRFVGRRQLPTARSGAQSVFPALLLMAANIRKIRAWRALTARDKARITQRARQRRTSLRNYHSDG
jgi:hypothetical protein